MERSLTRQLPTQKRIVLGFFGTLFPVALLSQQSKDQLALIAINFAAILHSIAGHQLVIITTHTAESMAGFFGVFSQLLEDIVFLSIRTLVVGSNGKIIPDWWRIGIDYALEKYPPAHISQFSIITESIGLGQYLALRIAERCPKSFVFTFNPDVKKLMGSEQYLKQYFTQFEFIPGQGHTGFKIFFVPKSFSKEIGIYMYILCSLALNLKNEIKNPLIRVLELPPPDLSANANVNPNPKRKMDGEIVESSAKRPHVVLEVEPLDPLSVLAMVCADAQPAHYASSVVSASSSSE